MTVLVLKSNLIKQLKGLHIVTLKNWINKINFLFLERKNEVLFYW
jgi:hypothetical protein